MLQTTVLVMLHYHIARVIVKMLLGSPVHQGMSLLACAGMPYQQGWSRLEISGRLCNACKLDGPELASWIGLLLFLLPRHNQRT
jgi:hypothetical protein